MSNYEQTKMQLDVYLAEYRMLKYEQTVRIGVRDNIVYVALVTAAAVFAFALEYGYPIVLMGLAPATFVLGWIHTNNDAKSAAIGCYLRYKFGDRICVLSGSDYPVFGWEFENRSGTQRRWRKLTDFLSNIITFVSPGVLALLIYWFKYHDGNHLWILVPATIAESLLLVVLLIWIFVKADLCWSGADTRRQ